MSDEQPDYLGLHAKGLFTFDHRQRISGINQFNGGVPPRFYLARSSKQCFCFIGQSVEDNIALELEALVATEPRIETSQLFQQQPPVHDKQYRRLLMIDRQVSSHEGPVFFVTPPSGSAAHGGFIPPSGSAAHGGFIPPSGSAAHGGFISPSGSAAHGGFISPSGSAAHGGFISPPAALNGESVVQISAENAGLLEKYLPDWLPDVAHRTPFWAALDEGHAVAVCASVRMTPEAHEAGVETHRAFRQQGHAARAVSAWASSIYDLGAIPVYSTQWTNAASQAVAMKLNLEIVGADFHLL